MNSFTRMGKWSVPAAQALVALALLGFAIGCGSSGGGPTPPLGGNYSNSSLNGQYVFVLTGIGVNQSGSGVNPFSETQIFAANGNGGLTVTIDDFDQIGGPYGGSVNYSGTYSIRSDGTGYLFFNNSPTVTSTYAITMIDDSHFYAIEQDSFATGSGYGEKQDTTQFSTPPAGTFIFKSHNLGVNSRVGMFNISRGAVSGLEDIDSFSTGVQSFAITNVAGMSAPDSNGRGHFKISDGTGANLTFNYYVVGANRFRFLSAAQSSLEVGDADTQTGAPFGLATLAGGNSYVFGSAGDTVKNQPGIHSGGVFTTDGNGNVTAGTVDFVEDSTVNSDINVLGGTYTLASNGRGVLNLTLSGANSYPRIFWMVSPNLAFFLVNSTAVLEDGSFNLQSALGAGLTGQSAFAMDGFDSTGTKDRVGAFQATSSGNLMWNQQANSFNSISGGILSGLGTTGTSAFSTNGRVAVTVNGVTASLVFYLSGPSTGVMVEEDANIGGSFTVQSGS
jgi:hypothetical protein